MNTSSNFNMKSPRNQAVSRQSGNGDQMYSYGMGKGAGQAPAPYQGYEQMQSANPRNAYPNQGAYSVQPEAYPQMQQAQSMQAPNGIQEKTKVKKKKPKSFWIAIVIALLCIALIGVLVFTMLGPTKSARQGDAGQLDGKTQAEIQAELDRVVEEGMFNISIASTVQFANGTSEGELRIENVPGNRYLMRVEITRDDTAETIYSTDFIEPNHHIQADVLDVDLPQGTYDCTATFFAYESDTEELVGQAAAKVNIEVLG